MYLKINKALSNVLSVVERNKGLNKPSGLNIVTEFLTEIYTFKMFL